MDRPVLVLGAFGSFGGAMALALAAQGRRVRTLARNPARRPAWLAHPFIETSAGDALDQAAVRAAAAGCEAIVHGVNYPYHQWVPNMRAVTVNVIAAARTHAALIVFPGNVYGFGAQTGRPLDESAPMRPNSRKGRLRVEIEVLLRAATEDGGARVLILRAGDYFGPTVRNGLVDRIFGNAARGKPMEVFGRLDVAHQWAYVPDLARIGAELMAPPGALRRFEVVHFAGYVAPTQSAFLDAVARAAGLAKSHVRRLPWWAVRAMAVFNPGVRELLELRYLFDQAVIIDDSRRRALLPGFVATPLAEAIAATVQSYRNPTP
ncbi:MAG: NAD-dependent epimerase/dehydratase family protein [Alphaproteobacteria bacterium]